MGVKCSKQPKLMPIILEEDEIELSSVSPPDNFDDSGFIKFEKKFEQLKNVNFIDFAKSMVFNYYFPENVDDYSIISDDFKDALKSFKREMNYNMIDSFISNTVLTHQNMIIMENKDKNLFTDIIVDYSKLLVIQLKQVAKNKGLPYPNDTIQKLYLLAIGLLYCGGKNVTKIKIIFDLFQQCGKLSSTVVFSNFLTVLFLIPSFCILTVRGRLKKHPELKEIRIDNPQLKQVCALEDVQQLVNNTKCKLFGDGQGSVNYSEFKGLFTIPDYLSYIFSPKGIRVMLFNSSN